MTRILVAAGIAALVGSLATAEAASNGLVTLHLGDGATVSGTTVLCHVQTGPTTGWDLFCGTKRAKDVVIISDKYLAVLSGSTGNPIFVRQDP